MRIDWDMPIKMEDGVVLRCDIYRPIADGKYPVIMTYGPYGKWLLFEDLYKDQWRRMCADQPDVPTGSTNKYQNWEVVDPEKWVPEDYICIRVDSRGAGRSPGVIDIWSLREAQDLAQCVDWAGVQPWSNGKVGLNGISYYAENQWQAAALQPKHLAAICTWEGAADFYRDMAHHGGIFCRGFVQDWSKAQVYTVQNGRGTRGFKSGMTGDWVSGPETLSEEQSEKIVATSTKTASRASSTPTNIGSRACRTGTK
jgi:putative CocE/NonD family hydrolase